MLAVEDANESADPPVSQLTPFEVIQTTYFERKTLVQHDTNFWLSTVSNLREVLQPASASKDVGSLKHAAEDCKKFLISVFEDAVEAFPTWGHMWRQYAETMEQCGERQTALSVYKRGLEETHSLELYVSYVQCVYNGGHLLPLVDSLTQAVSTVGMDIRSRPLWRELLALRIKLHNMRTTPGDLTPPGRLILLDPFLAVEKRHTGTVEDGRLFTDEQLALMVSAAQDLATTLPSIGEDVISKDPNLRQLQDRLPVEQTFDKVRCVYRDWLSTPTSGLQTVWQGYTQFENSLSGGGNGGGAPGQRQSTNRLLANKMILSGQTLFTASQTAYQVLKRMMRGLHSKDGTLSNTESPAVPLTDDNIAATKAMTRQWLNVLAYETTNPIQLTFSAFCTRLQGVFELCLASCGFQPVIWIMYVQTLLSLDRTTQAISCLQRAIDRFLPHDEFLQLILADVMRARGNPESTFQLLLSMVVRATPQRSRVRAQLCAALQAGLPPRYKHLWSPVLIELNDTSDELQELGDDVASVDEPTQSVPADTVALIHLLNFVRTLTDLSHAHALFLALHHFGPHHLYLYHARVLWRTGGNARSAGDVLALGAERFRDDEDYVLGHADLLLEMGLLHECRNQLLTAASRFYTMNRVAPRRVWSKLFHVESRYGPNVVQKKKELEAIFAQQLVSLLPDERLLTGADDFLFNSFSGRILCPPPDIDETHFQSTPAITHALAAGVPHGSDAKQALKEYGMKHRMYGCGVSIEELYKSQCFGTSHPKTVLTHFLSPSASTVSQTAAAADSDRTARDADDPAVSGGADEEDDGVDTNGKAADVRASRRLGDKVGRRGTENITNSTSTMFPVLNEETSSATGVDAKRVALARPDASKMVLFNPLLLATSSHEEDGRALDETQSSNVLCPSGTWIPRPLQNFIALLPRISPLDPVGRDLSHTRLVDHVLLSIQTATIPSISIQDYTPIPRPALNDSYAKSGWDRQLPTKLGKGGKLSKKAPAILSGISNSVVAVPAPSNKPRALASSLGPADPAGFGRLWKRARRTLSKFAEP